ncbi:trichohyalin-like [Cloeon dipterum]|uniref:trichohyalin-like n=1 Tax=Cloeon dipterum TaxID=197152 RepID=UPI00321F7FD0
MNYLDSITDLYRKYMECRSVIAKMKNSLSICSGSEANHADLDNELESDDDNWPPRSEPSCTCEKVESEPHRCTTVITIPEGLQNSTPAATITVTKSLDVVGDFSGLSHKQCAGISCRRRLEHMRREKERAVSQFQMQNFQVRELSESLRKTEEKLRKEVEGVEKKLRDASDVVREARAEAKQARSELAESKNELEESRNESSVRLEQSCKLLEQSRAIARKLQNKLREREAELQDARTRVEALRREKIDCVEKANREAVNQARRQSQLALEKEKWLEEGLKSKLEKALEQLSEWKERCGRADARHAALRQDLARRRNECELKMEAKEEQLTKAKQEAARLVQEIETWKEARSKNGEELAAWRRRAAAAKSQADELRKKELISERRLSDAFADREQIRAENGRLKIQLQQTIKKLEDAQRASTAIAAEKLAALHKENGEMRLALREMAERHRIQVDDLKRTNDGLLEKICQIRRYVGLEGNTSKKASVRFHATRTQHNFHDAAFCAYNEPQKT